MSQSEFISPKIFKGIALFTPGGDLIYCLDPSKQEHWHLHLCAGLQDLLGLPEPPHFLIPCYTATIDRWLDRQSQQVQTFAEVYPLVRRYQALLNAVFETGDLNWQVTPGPEGLCDHIVLASYRSLFPQLWEDHDLVVRFERTQPAVENHQPLPRLELPKARFPQLCATKQDTPGYVLRLFVAGNSANTERILQTLHQLLDQYLHHPYTLKVIDVFKHPEQAEANQVSATPTLVKVWPRPVRRLVGELDHVEKLLQILTSPGSLND